MKRKYNEGRAITVGTEQACDSVRLRKGRFSVSEGYQQLLTATCWFEIGSVQHETRKGRK